MKVGGVITAVAVVLLLAYTYVGSAGAPQTAAPETTPPPRSTAASRATRCSGRALTQM